MRPVTFIPHLLSPALASAPAGSPAGAEASAGWYSFIETAKLNGVEPYLYLNDVLSRLPEGDSPEAFKSLVP